jgi:hypothetical protein
MPSVRRSTCWDLVAKPEGKRPLDIGWEIILK